MEVLPSFVNFEAAILESLQASVIVSDLAGRLLYANPFSEHLYGRPVSHLVGSLAAEVAGVELAPQTGFEILQALLAGQSWEGDFRVQRPDGSTIVAHAVDSGLFDEHGALTAVVSVVTDVSDERRSLDRLSQLYTERDRVAQSLQAALLPPTLPQVEGLQLAARYRAAGEANDVGGDFYDLFPLGSGAWTAVVGDVTGRGPDAAAVTGLVRYAIRASAHEARHPARMLQVTNGVLWESQGALAERFCSAACAVVRPGDSTSLVTACAGHPPPLILRADGGLEQPECRGLALGVAPRLELTPTSTRLHRGDAAIFYTDGLSEARDGGDRFFGEVALPGAVTSCRGLEAEAMASQLLEIVEIFSDGRIGDDLALLVIRVPPS